MLFKADELDQQRVKGHVFQGWKEGFITFPPTYKFIRGTDFYTGELIPVAKDTGRDGPLGDAAEGQEPDCEGKLTMSSWGWQLSHQIWLVISEN